GQNYGNVEPTLNSNTSHLLFVNASDGLSLFMVHNNTNHAENGNGGFANTQWELSGGTENVLKSDDDGEAVASDGGTVFTAGMAWAQENTDGMVVGPLPVGFTILVRKPSSSLARKSPRMRVACSKSWSILSKQRRSTYFRTVVPPT